ncbi:MAG: MaoC family dehydratase [Cytophagales bacterium]|nr:MaoC family dehydratase [Cytophagales bacterium]
MNFVIGDFAESVRTFSQADVEAFAQLSGDNNPVHLDESFAASTVFKKRVVHGALVNSLFSKVLGTQFPGKGSIYLSQESTFKAPVYPGDEVKVRVELKDVKGKIGIFSTLCIGQGDKVLVEGTAKVRLPG